jgi:putative ABC transport system permease protein
MTVTGIAGCTALMVAAFGLRDSMIDIARTQFEEILRYDVQLNFSLKGEAFPELPPGSPLRRRLPIHSESAVLSPGTDTKGLSISLVVPQNPEALGEYITLRDRKNRESLPFSATSVVLTEKIAETWGLKPGDRVVLENAAGRRGSFTLSGITENYVGATVYLGPTVYTQELGGPLVYQTLFAYTDRVGTLQDDLVVPPVVFEVPCQFLLLRIHRNYRLPFASSLWHPAPKRCLTPSCSLFSIQFPKPH